MGDGGGRNGLWESEAMVNVLLVVHCSVSVEQRTRREGKEEVKRVETRESGKRWRKRRKEERKKKEKKKRKVERNRVRCVNGRTRAAGGDMSFMQEQRVCHTLSAIHWTIGLLGPLSCPCPALS